MEKEEVEDKVFEWCPSCSRYTYHVRTANNIIRCKECGHGQWSVSYTHLTLPTTERV